MQRSLLTRWPGKRFLATVAKHNICGDPQKVLQLETIDAIGKVGDNQVKIKFLASPINPSDINIVQGVYGIPTKVPAIGGNEGVAVVTEIGSKVHKLAVGDWVIPLQSGFGCWRTEALTDPAELIKVANDIPPAYAATLSVNPATAYRLLRDFGALKPGDVIMQNGANSMVGLAVIQMARMMGIKTINIIRSDRPDADTVLRLLSNLGGDVNVLDTQVNTVGFNEILADLPPCKLAFNCIGGDSTTEMVRCLAPGGTLVTYGGMSKRPLTLPCDLVIYKELKLAGFWMAAWYAERGADEKTKMMDEIAVMIRSKQLAFFFEMHDFDDFHHALDISLEQFNFRKVVLNLDYPDRLKEHDERNPDDYFVFEADN